MFLPKNFHLLLLLSATIVFAGCDYNNPRLRKNKKPISFSSVEGITFTEVSRKQKNGLSFNEQGYHLAPEWRLRFEPKDSVALYSPEKKQFVNFPLSRGIDSIFATSHSFFKMLHMSKDSMVLDMLQAKDDTLDRTNSAVRMTFYADNYIKNNLHATIDQARHVSHADSVFLKKLIGRANADIKNAFAAQQPVNFISKRPAMQVSFWHRTPKLYYNNYDYADNYMTPTFDITLSKAYKHFDYSLSVFVDAKGQITYRMPMVGFYGDDQAAANYVKISKFILDNYLKPNLTVVPGQTLGIPHTSIVTLHIHGRQPAFAQTVSANK
ncbi:hypothetical protein [Mucilaginibacter pedocola]|uniref:Uncharacterized protein n=1 Tax=Mucilaginibacter pedocola TaxID=1792845 RepID=A0A1S9PCE5_9SPHI|nr:hypothetical protein [Mucilaginibacter pedocola]OOQ58630.1 hypothetical protein BC343_08165 [Mucilaginibacter pedocola]